MAQIVLKQGQSFHTDNQTLYLVTDGSLSGTCAGGTLSLRKGDTAGILELFKKDYFFIYQAESDVVLNAFPVASPDVLHDYLNATPGSRQLLVTSALGQITTLLRQYETTFFECESLYDTLVQDYRQYVLLCQKYQYPAQILSGFDKIKAPIRMNGSFFSSYYESLTSTSTSLLSKPDTDSWLITGIIYHCGQDCDRILKGLNHLAKYQELIASLYLNSGTNDLLTLNLSVLSRLHPNQEDAFTLLSQIRFMLTSLEMGGNADMELLKERNMLFEDQEERLSNPVDEAELSDTETASPITLTGSLEQILAYSTLSIEEKEALRELLSDYAALPDKASSDEGPRRIYKQFTEKFLNLYRNITMKALDDSAIPVIVRMFLYFGYLDEDLAGLSNARFLAQTAESYAFEEGKHVYTLFDWLTAIYQGKKEPSRNEFDEEYSDILHKQKIKGEISAAQERELLSDGRKKVEHELSSMFPQVNKMTYGRISSYCPVFSEHDVLRPLPKAYVTATRIAECIQKIRETDYSAFYRETIYSNPESGINKEYIHVEALPDFILMPNTGIRGAMWQEIENRRRTTSCRMMLPIFYLEDLSTRIIHLTGEYRWEMCKRIQGARWNDLTEMSLTSEYFDYIQFYRKNNELSVDAKEKIKNALAKTKNNYKEMFVQDYMSWILYESAGSPRLNKVARQILFTYCTFVKEIRKSLEVNPLYREILDRYNIKNAQKVHHLDILRQKLSNSRNPLPPEIEEEYLYVNK